jgi:hypothetical protein
MCFFSGWHAANYQTGKQDWSSSPPSLKTDGLCSITYQYATSHESYHNLRDIKRVLHIPFSFGFWQRIINTHNQCPIPSVFQFFIHLFIKKILDSDVINMREVCIFHIEFLQLTP